MAALTPASENIHRLFCGAGRIFISRLKLLKHLTLVVAFDFLRLLLTRWTRDRADLELERVENRQNIHQNVHEKWESPWNVGLQPEGSHCHHSKTRRN